VYADVEAVEADYELVKDLHTKAGVIDAYDAAVIQRCDDGKVKIARKHETPTRFSAREIADQLGHARSSLTQDVYMGRKIRNPRAVNAIEDVLRRADEDQKGG